MATWSINESFLPVNYGNLYVAPYPSSGITTLLADRSNADTIVTELEALTYTNVWEVIDLTINEDRASNLLKIDSDNRWTIYTSTRPDVNIAWTFWQAQNPNITNVFFNESVLSDVSNEYGWTNIDNVEVANLVVKITSTYDDDWSSRSRTDYLVKCVFEETLAKQFIDPTRAGDLPWSPFLFMGQKGWFYVYNRTTW